jgi:hypothetical protein
LSISRFYPVLVELGLSFVVGSARLVLFGPTAAMDQPIGCGGLLRFPAFLPFSRDTKINNVTHSSLDGSQVRKRARPDPYPTSDY